MVNISKNRVYLNGFYFKENTTRFRYKHKPLFWETVTVYFENRKKLISNLNCRQNAEVTSAELGGISSNQCALTDYFNNAFNRGRSDVWFQASEFNCVYAGAHMLLKLAIYITPQPTTANTVKLFLSVSKLKKLPL
jgi:hypothetical protein